MKRSVKIALRSGSLNDSWQYSSSDLELCTVGSLLQQSYLSKDRERWKQQQQVTGERSQCESSWQCWWKSLERKTKTRILPSWWRQPKSKMTMHWLRPRFAWWISSGGRLAYLLLFLLFYGAFWDQLLNRLPVSKASSQVFLGEDPKERQAWGKKRLDCGLYDHTFHPNLTPNACS